MKQIQEDTYIKAIMSEAELEHDYNEFAQFCRELLKGLRKQAFKHIEVFLNQTTEWEFQKRIQFVIWICERAENAEYYHKIMVHPLLVNLIKPVLDEWITKKPYDPRPYRWSGVFLTNLPNNNSNPYECYRMALEVDSKDERSKVLLANLLIKHIWYATHHLPDFYIGDPKEDLKEIDNIISLIDSILDSKVRGDLRNEVDMTFKLIEDWLSFKNEGGTDFTNWCEENNRKYRWVKAYYYDR